ncbi:MAG: ABC transporter ATP-binding protein [Rhizobiaceae bacterium]|jgi:NitT/TauT family transport system ATP-binding protein
MGRADLHGLAGQNACAAGPTAIEFQNVDLSYSGKPILADLSLAVGKGEIVCIIGPSGCGKTTALRVAGGLVQPGSGSVTVGGKPVTGPRRDVAIVFQDYGKALLPWRTAAGNVSLALEAAGTPVRERKDRIHVLLEKVGLHGHADKYPTEMSGGMQQRLQIARCLAQEPSVLLMDEPFGALDAMTRQTLQDETLSIVAETGATVFFVTHDLEEAIYLGDRVIGLLPNPGRIGTIARVDLPRPRNQLETREMPEFLRLRRTLFDFIEKAEG